MPPPPTPTPRRSSSKPLARLPKGLEEGAPVEIHELGAAGWTPAKSTRRVGASQLLVVHELDDAPDIGRVLLVREDETPESIGEKPGGSLRCPLCVLC